METFKINYKSDFVLRLASDAGWGTAFTLEFWAKGAATKRYYATHDGNGNYTNCKPDSDTELRVMFDDHGLGIGNLMLRITYSLADEEFRTGKDDEVVNVAAITVLNDEGEEVNVMLNLEGETAAEVQYSLPLLEAEKQRQNAEAQRIADEQQRQQAETLRNQAELGRQASEDTRKNNERARETAELQRQTAEAARVTEFETNEAERQATFDANEAERQVLYEKVAKNTEEVRELGTQVIYDVSANNGEAIFASLSELLSSENLSTLIPTAVRCGGMSIRFVQSSDNKYVQYRLLSKTFNTTPANWQKDFTNKEIFDKNTEETRKNGYELMGNGKYTENSDWNSSGDMYVSEDLQYETNYAGNIFCYDANGNFINIVVSGTDLLAGTTHVRINWKKTQNAPYFYSHSNALQLPIDNHAKRLEEAEKRLNNVEPFEPRLSSVENRLNYAEPKIDYLEEEIYENLNHEEDFHIGYEIEGNGAYAPNELYDSSGNLYVSSNLKYKTNYAGNIFCLNESGCLGRVMSGQPLIEGTTFVRLNWFKTQDAPYFIALDDESVQEQFKNLEAFIQKSDNLNHEEDFHLGYEIVGNGAYAPNELYDSSGDIPADSNMGYETNYIGNIFCYSNSAYIGYVVSGRELLAGTTFVRLNWLKTQNAPYFRVIKSYQIFEDMSIKANGDDMLETELQSNGTTAYNANWRTSQMLSLDEGKNYKCNVSANYYYYDGYQTFLGRVYTPANTLFNRNSYNGARFMCTNAPMSSPILIYEIDRYGMTEVTRMFNGIASKALDCGVSDSNINADVKIEQNINVQLPAISSSVEIRFKTSQSLYKQSESVGLFRIGNIARISLSPIEVEESFYCDKCEANICVIMGGSEKIIPMRLNNYGKDLFSIRLKYPVVNVAVNGLTEMVTPMPTEYQGMYLRKTSDTFAVMNGDDTIFKSWQTSEYSDVDAFVEAIKLDTDITDIFDIKKYGCEGVLFSQINNFDKIGLCKEHTEILYTQGSPNPYYTGNVYWDSYPTFLRTSDVGYEHVLKINYKVINGFIKKVQVSIDGMFVRFTGLNESSENLKVLANINGIISEVVGMSVLPYKPIRTPMLSMQHYVKVDENLQNQNMVTTTMRQYDALAYLKKKGFVGQNFDECMSSIRGSAAIDKPIYCLTFDDHQKNIWTNKEIRDVFNQFRAKPTLIYLFVAEDFSGVTPPSYALSADEYKAVKASGWDVISHGFCMYSDKLSYAQFYQGFLRNKDAWLRWYGEDVQSYNAHGAEITDYQYYLMKHMGFNSIASGSAYLGWFCECGTTIEVQYKRVTWMDSELNWETVKNNIDEWAE